MALDESLEHLTLRPRQIQSSHEQRNRVTPRDVLPAALHVADAALAHAGAFGQLLLSQASCASVVAQEIAKSSVRFVCPRGGDRCK